jgi:hypothetical protein
VLLWHTINPIQKLISNAYLIKLKTWKRKGEGGSNLWDIAIDQAAGIQTCWINKGEVKAREELNIDPDYIFGSIEKIRIPGQAHSDVPAFVIGTQAYTPQKEKSALRVPSKDEIDSAKKDRYS